MPSILPVLFTYVLALGAAVATALAVPGYPLLRLLAADGAATLVVFGMGMLYRNASFYDAYWSVAPLPLLLGYAALEGGEWRLLPVALLASGWGARLTWNWYRGWQGLKHQDWRYVDLEAETGRLYPLVNLFGIHLFPTLLVFGGLLPAFYALASPLAPGILDAVGIAVCVGGLGLEAVADQQLRRFVASDPPQGAILQTGLWAYSRHPNYLGEITWWVGLLLIGLSAGAPAWTAVGALAMLGLFLGVSIPLIERRMVARRPAYTELQQRIPMLLPWPLAKGPPP